MYDDIFNSVKNYKLKKNLFIKLMTDPKNFQSSNDLNFILK